MRHVAALPMGLGLAEFYQGEINGIWKYCALRDTCSVKVIANNIVILSFW